MLAENSTSGQDSWQYPNPYICMKPDGGEVPGYNGYLCLSKYRGNLSYQFPPIYPHTSLVYIQMTVLT